MRLLLEQFAIVWRTGKPIYNRCWFKHDIRSERNALISRVNLLYGIMLTLCTYMYVCMYKYLNFNVDIINFFTCGKNKWYAHEMQSVYYFTNKLIYHYITYIRKKINK